MVYSSTVFIYHVKDRTENATINDVFVANVAEGRGRFATQLGAFNDDYTADRALDSHTNDEVSTAPHCAQPNGDIGDYAWWMVDLGKQYVIDRVTIHSSNGTASRLLHWS